MADDDDLRKASNLESPGNQVRPQASTASEKFEAAGRNQGVEDVNDEQQLWTGGYSGKAMVGSWIVAAVVSFGLLALAVYGATISMGMLAIGAFVVILAAWIWLGGLYLYRRMSVQYELTSQRFLHREGIFQRRTERIEVIDMDDITCTQGFVERMMGVGTIKIDSSDRTHPVLYLRGIDNVNEVANLIDNTRRRERRKRGLHIESI